jgi:hypothetical protein
LDCTEPAGDKVPHVGLDMDVLPSAEFAGTAVEQRDSLLLLRGSLDLDKADVAGDKLLVADNLLGEDILVGEGIPAGDMDILHLVGLDSHPDPAADLDHRSNLHLELVAGKWVVAAESLLS